MLMIFILVSSFSLVLWLKGASYVAPRVLLLAIRDVRKAGGHADDCNGDARHASGDPPRGRRHACGLHDVIRDLTRAADSQGGDSRNLRKLQSFRGSLTAQPDIERVRRVHLHA